MQDGEEEDAGRGDRGRDVAEDVDLRPARALRPVARGAAARRRSPARRASCAARRPCWPACAGRAARGRASPAAASSARRRGGPRPGPGSGWSAAPGRARPAGREGGRVEVRSIRSRSSSRRRWRSKRLSCSRSIGGSSAAPSSAGGWVPAESPSVRRIRCTSTPTTPEPSPWRPKAAIASRARSRISSVVALEDRLAHLLAQLVDVEPLAALVALALPRRCPRSIASASAARKNQRSKSSSNRRRSSWDLAIVAASASRKSSCEVQGTSSSAAKASRISEVPTATPSLRSSSQKPSSFAASPGGPASGLGAVGGRQASPRLARRPGRCRCGA